MVTLYAGAARVDITPAGPVWMDGMIREHRSTGVHDALFARCLVHRRQRGATGGRRYAIVSVDVCALDETTIGAARRAAAARTGIPAAQIIVAATHTHSGPATYGFFCPREEPTYELGSTASPALVAAALRRHAAGDVACGSASGRHGQPLSPPAGRQRPCHHELGAVRSRSRSLARSASPTRR